MDVVLLVLGILLVLLGAAILSEDEGIGFLPLIIGVAMVATGLIGALSAQEEQPQPKTAPVENGADYVTTTVTTEG